ncbi:hypothetical protein [Thalassobacter stenotrophicus]|uniref:hypothetical protein n=1 Tax=Thalassobacter stenotrophicus TaxID=266809 RepID=UPI00071AF59E|nr:hypothetical protein [Thalassobacter stenotrophicus]
MFAGRGPAVRFGDSVETALFAGRAVFAACAEVSALICWFLRTGPGPAKAKGGDWVAANKALACHGDDASGLGFKTEKTTGSQSHRPLQKMFCFGVTCGLKLQGQSLDRALEIVRSKRTVSIKKLHIRVDASMYDVSEGRH